jgi:hypothetical protein
MTTTHPKKMNTVLSYLAMNSKALPYISKNIEFPKAAPSSLMAKSSPCVVLKMVAETLHPPTWK